MLDKIKDGMRSINKKYLLINFMVAFVGAFVIGFDDIRKIEILKNEKETS